MNQMTTHSRAITLYSCIKIISKVHQLGVTGPLCVFSAMHNIPQEPLLKYLSALNSCLEERGTTGAIKWNKTVRNCFTRWISGDPLGKGHGVRISRKVPGIPWILEGFGLVDRYDDRVKTILSLLILTRSIPGGKDPGVHSITSSYTGSWTSDAWDDLVFDRFRRRVTKTRKDYIPRVSSNPWILTTKNGPSGHALTTCYSELKLFSPVIFDAISTLLGESTVDVIRRLRFLQNNNNPEGSDEFEDYKAMFSLREVENPSLAKITTIPDKEGKSRNIAMGSYWVQVALNPIHTWAIRALKGIPEDCTYDQTKSQSVLKKEQGHRFWSFDLSSATDRFPLEFQYKLVTAFFGEKYGTAWKTLVSPVFKHISGDIQYTVGQPIGFLSSWSIFSLAHHLVVYMAGNDAGISVRNKYVLLGDDIVICDDRLAAEYRKWIERLGVDISPLKSHVSHDTYEFAKRWYQDGREISPFPILAFSNKHYTTILSGVIASLERGWSLRGMNVAQVCSLFSALISGHNGPDYVNRVEGKFILYYSVYRAIKGYESWTTVWNNLRYNRRELQTMRSTHQSPQFGEHLYRLTIFAMYYTQGMGALVSKSTELKTRYSGSVYWDSGLNILPASTEEGSFIAILPQVKILERLKDHMLRVIANAETIEPEDYFKTLMGKNRDEPIGLLTSDLNTLFTQRTQPTGWTVLNCLVSRMSTYASKINKVGISFRNELPVPTNLALEILGPLLKYGDYVAVGSRDDPVISRYWETHRQWDVVPVTPPWMDQPEEEVKSHSAYYGGDITFNWS